MKHTAKRIILRERGGQGSVPALLIEGLSGGRAVIVEPDPQSVGRTAPLHGSRIYFADLMRDSFSVVNQIEVEEDAVAAAQQYADAYDCLRRVTEKLGLRELAKEQVAA